MSRKPSQSAGAKKSSKKCFVICPIGDEKSEQREWSNTVLDYIIKPVAESEKYGYTVIRADKIQTPGIITTQIIELLLSADLVIADLSYKNPNVFYELAVRHATRKPYIQMINKDEKIPFDIGGNRTIFFNTDIKYADRAKRDLDDQINSIVNGNVEIENPIGNALNFINLKSSGNSEQMTIATVLEKISELKSEIFVLNRKLENSKTQKNENFLWGSEKEHNLVDEFNIVDSRLNLIDEELKEQKASNPDKVIEMIEEKRRLIGIRNKIRSELAEKFGIFISD
jgi:hypothetical protein